MSLSQVEVQGEMAAKQGRRSTQSTSKQPTLGDIFLGSILKKLLGAISFFKVN